MPSADNTFTMNDVRGYLGINHTRQHAICNRDKKNPVVPKTRLAESGHEVSYYTANQFRKFLKLAGYHHVVFEGRVALVHEKYIKEHPKTEVIT